MFIQRQYSAETRSRQRAAKELQVNNSEEELENSDTKIDEIAIKTLCCDETLQKRDHSSLNDIITIFFSMLNIYT